MRRADDELNPNPANGDSGDAAIYLMILKDIPALFLIFPFDLRMKCWNRDWRLAKFPISIRWFRASHLWSLIFARQLRLWTFILVMDSRYPCSSPGTLGFYGVDSGRRFNQFRRVGGNLQPGNRLYTTMVYNRAVVKNKIINLADQGERCQYPKARSQHRPNQKGHALACPFPLREKLIPTQKAMLRLLGVRQHPLTRSRPAGPPSPPRVCVATEGGEGQNTVGIG
jgi:hypothetical protein